MGPPEGSCFCSPYRRLQSLQFQNTWASCQVAIEPHCSSFSGYKVWIPRDGLAAHYATAQDLQFPILEWEAAGFSILTWTHQASHASICLWQHSLLYRFLISTFWLQVYEPNLANLRRKWEIYWKDIRIIVETEREKCNWASGTNENQEVKIVQILSLSLFCSFLQVSIICLSASQLSVSQSTFQKKKKGSQWHHWVLCYRSNHFSFTLAVADKETGRPTRITWLSTNQLAMAKGHSAGMG